MKQQNINKIEKNIKIFLYINNKNLSDFVNLEKILEYFKIQERLLSEKIIRYKIIKGYTSCCTFPIIFCQKLSFKN